MGVGFTDNTINVTNALTQAIENAVEECASEVEAAVKRGCDLYVMTGQTKNSFEHVTQTTSDGCMAAIGSDYENAIWEEFGTGEYAADGNGRKGGWVYVDENGNGHFTLGKHPRRVFLNAWNGVQGKVESHLQEVIGREMSR